MISKSNLRSISAIANDIRKEWKPVYYGAVPYLNAMLELNTVQDNYGCDDGRSIVNYFLSNARNFRGDQAKVLKEELKAHLKSRP